MRQKIGNILIFSALLAAGGANAGVEVPIAPPGTRGAGSLSDTIIVMDAAVITERRTERDLSPVQVLSGADLQRLNTVSVADAIRYFSGVQIKDYGGIGGLKTVNIRSMGSQHVGVFYDGVQLGNAQNGQVDLGRFSMDNMDAIEIYNGQRASVFQSARDFASSGALYLTTRRPDGGNHLRFSFRTGSFAVVNPAVLWEHKITNKINSQLSAEWMNTSGRYRFKYSTADGYSQKETRRNGDVRALRVEGGLFGRLEYGDWMAKLYAYDSERGYPGASVREEPGRFPNEDRQWDTNLFTQAVVRQFFERWKLQASAKYANDAMHYRSDPRLDVTTMWVDHRFRQHELYFSTTGEVRLLDWWRLSAAADVQNNTVTGNMAGFTSPRRLALLTVAATAVERGRFKGQASMLLTRVQDHAEGIPTTTRHDWSPSVMASFAMKTVILRAFYKRTMRLPTLSDIHYTIISVPRKLRPERTEQWNIGAVWTSKFGVEAQVDAYFNRVHDKLVAVPTKNQFQWPMINLGYVEIQGVDASLTATRKVGAVSARARLTYTYQRARDLTDRNEEWFGHQIPYIPWNSGSLTLGARFCEWGVNYSFIYAGERYESRANTPENHALPWYTSDMSLSKEFGRWRITVEVNNIFNQQYEVVRCYPMPGTNFMFKINFE